VSRCTDFDSPQGAGESRKLRFLQPSWRIHVPLDSILVVIAVTMMFLTFAVVLGWGERQTRKM
jgi:hypothetical protein